MASSPATTALHLFIAAVLISVASTASAACSASKTFSNNRTFAACSDLPSLAGVLYWTYNQQSSSLSLAFSAPPPRPAGWVSWGINPSQPAMIGTQALVAYKLPNGSVAAVTFNVSEFAIKPSPINYPVSDFAAESDAGGIVIFATLALPGGTTTVNQVWQVGPGVTGGIPAKHDFAPDNLKATGVLNLVGGGSVPPSASPGPSSVLPPPPSSVPSSDSNGPSLPPSASSTVGVSSSWPAAVVAAVALLLLHRLY